MVIIAISPQGGIGGEQGIRFEIKNLLKGVLEVVEDTLDGAVVIVWMKGLEADILQCHIPFKGPITVVDRSYNVG